MTRCLLPHALLAIAAGTLLASTGCVSSADDQAPGGGDGEGGKSDGIASNFPFAQYYDAVMRAVKYDATTGSFSTWVNESAPCEMVARKFHLSPTRATAPRPGVYDSMLAYLVGAGVFSEGEKNCIKKYWSGMPSGETAVSSDCRGLVQFDSIPSQGIPNHTGADAYAERISLLIAALDRDARFSDDNGQTFFSRSCSQGWSVVLDHENHSTFMCEELLADTANPSCHVQSLPSFDWTVDVNGTPTMKAAFAFTQTAPRCGEGSLTLTNVTGSTLTIVSASDHINCGHANVLTPHASLTCDVLPGPAHHTIDFVGADDFSTYFDTECP